MVSTIGAFTIGLSMLLFLYNIIRSRKKGAIAGDDPWDGRTLEWTISSPPPEHNFDVVPTVESLDDFWHQKYTEDEEGRLLLRTDTDTDERPEVDPASIHMPSPSYYPALASLGLVILGYGLVYLSWGWIAVAVGALTALWGFFGWSLEPVTKEAH
jgi:cytochrome c oxidase subunit 1